MKHCFQVSRFLHMHNFYCIFVHTQLECKYSSKNREKCVPGTNWSCYLRSARTPPETHVFRSHELVMHTHHLFCFMKHCFQVSQFLRMHNVCHIFVHTQLGQMQLEKSRKGCSRYEPTAQSTHLCFMKNLSSTHFCLMKQWAGADPASQNKLMPASNFFQHKPGSRAQVTESSNF